MEIITLSVKLWKEPFWLMATGPQGPGRALGPSAVAAVPLLRIQVSTRTHLRMLQHEVHGFFKVLQVQFSQIFREVFKFEISQSKHSKTTSGQEAGPVFTEATTTTKEIEDPREGPFTWRAPTIVSCRLSTDILGFQILAVKKEKFSKQGHLRVWGLVKRTLLYFFFFSFF